jgi:thiamine transport system substrate-binding protein
MKIFTKVVLLLLVLTLSACKPPTSALPTQPPVGAELNVMTHDSFAVSDGVIGDFERENNVKVNILKSGDTGAAVNRAVLTKDSPLADVFYGTDNSFLSRALDGDIFETYNSPLLAAIPAAYKLDSTNRALPVDYGDVCINYDTQYFAGKKLPLPQSLEDLVKPEYKGLLVVENPATSSPGLAFLLATVEHFGVDKYLDYWKSLRANGVVVVNDWSTAYYTNFSGSSGKGPQSMVISYASSPAAEVYFAQTAITEAPTASILEPGTCFRQIEFVGILKGTHQRALAEKFIDFLLGVQFQEDMPLQMFVFPVNPEARLPEVFQKYAAVADSPAQLSPDEIAKNRDTWIKAWDETVLR